MWVVVWVAKNGNRGAPRNCTIRAGWGGLACRSSKTDRVASRTASVNTNTHTQTHFARSSTRKPQSHTSQNTHKRIPKCDQRSYKPLPRVAIMRFALLTALSALAALVVADVEFTTPAAGAILTAGSTISIKWDDSGDAPKISALTSYQLFLCAGGNDDASYVRTDRAIL